MKNNSKVLKNNQLKKQTIIGLFWSSINQFGWLVSSIITSVILARLLTPQAFGTIAMVTVIINFSRIIVSFGFGQALIQKKTISNSELSSVFWLNFMIGVFSTIIIILLSRKISEFYNNDLLQCITILLSFNFVFYSLNTVHYVLFVKNLDFKSIAKVDFFSTLSADFIAITMAYLGAGIWSLVARFSLVAVISTLAYWFLNSWRPTFQFKWSEIQNIWKFSINLFGNQTLNYWTRNTDQILIGKFLSNVDLGIYRQAYVFAIEPINRISIVLVQVLFPTFSKIQDDKRLIADNFLKATRITALITFPILIGMFSCADTFIKTLLNSQWYGLIPLIRIFSIIGIMVSINSLFKSIFLSIDRTDLLFKFGLFERGTIVLGIVCGLSYGISGVAFGIFIAYLLHSPIFMYITGKQINLSMKQQISNILPVLLTSSFMGIFVWQLNEYLRNQLETDFFIMILNIILGSIFYILSLYCFKVKASIEFFHEIRSLIRTPYLKN